MGETFRCPHCGEVEHVDYLVYDRHGAGCSYCGGHLTQQQIINLTRKQPIRKENTNA